MIYTLVVYHCINMFFRNKRISIVILLLVLFISASCETKYINDIEDSQEIYKSGPIVEPDSVDINSSDYQAGVEIALRKAKQITDVRWTPVGYIPMSKPKGTFYQPGKTYKGIPYSSAKEKNKFVGQDVSLHTFLSAVTNPRSVLYTEIVNETPYHGTNCATYYGIVCSMSVNYALGIDAPYPSRSYSYAPFMQEVTKDSVDLINKGDILASSGHTIMAIDVIRDKEGAITDVRFFENYYYISFSRTELKDYWAKGNYVLYRYKEMHKNKYIQEIEPVIEHPSLCPNRGDKSVYRSDEQVVLNILDNTYQAVAIYRNGILSEKISLAGQDVILNDLSEGMYSALLLGDGKESEYTFFEIRDAIIQIEQDNNKILVSFEKNSIVAASIELCDISGDHLFTKLLSDEEKAKKTVQLNYLSRTAPYYCKVIFQGNYGKIPSKYIEIKR